MRLLHTADWQLGARFRQFGDRADRLRQARLQTLERALTLARDERVDAFLIAGDLFEDNYVQDSLVFDVVRLFKRFSDVPIHILPGNHDPSAGPGSIWLRNPFREPPDHVKVFREPGYEPVNDGFVLANPLTKKASVQDPSYQLGQIAADLPKESIKVGMTHGALAIEGKHQPHDHPIAPNAATQHGLDYLAIGHWHSWLALDDNRLLMPGTPEPDQFDQTASGYAALVEIAGRGEKPEITAKPIAGLKWLARKIDFLESSSHHALAEELKELTEQADSTVIRVVLNGTPERALYDAIYRWLPTRLDWFAAAQLVDKTDPSLSQAELNELTQRSPILAQVLNDLQSLSGGPTEQAENREGPGLEESLSMSDRNRLIKGLPIDDSDFDEAFYKAAHAMLLQELARHREPA